MNYARSKLVALVFHDPYTGEEARATLHRMGDDGLLEIDESALIAKYDHGRTRMSQDVNVINHGKKAGHIIGLVTAAISGTMPFVMDGTVAAQLVSKLIDNGATSKFVKTVAKELQPSTSALVLLTRSEAERRERVMERLQVFLPKVVECDLPADLECELWNSLQRSVAE